MDNHLRQIAELEQQRIATMQNTSKAPYPIVAAQLRQIAAQMQAVQSERNKAMALRYEDDGVPSRCYTGGLDTTKPRKR